LQSEGALHPPKVGHDDEVRRHGACEGGALRAAGLRSGDVILAVNGSELNSPQAIAGLRNRLSGATSAEIRYERDGAVQTTTIRTAQ
jgi:general secretion pathway protein C